MEMQGLALQDFVVAIFFGFGFLAAHWFLDRLVFRYCCPSQMGNAKERFYSDDVSYLTGYDVIEALPLFETYVFLLYYIFNTLLLMLLVFHIYGWVLIFRMIKKQLENRGKVGEDIRSDSDEEE